MYAFFMLSFVLPGAEPAPQNADLVQAWLKVSLRHAQDYVIHPENQPERPFSMLPQAVFRHSQPVRGDDIGAVYLWVTANQRPTVIGTTFAYTHEADVRTIVHEFHSLADSPLTATWREKRPWRPASPGLQFQPIAGIPPADDSSRVRQRQVRDLVRRFNANSIDHQGGRWELRMVSKPIHQFDIEKPDNTLSGALFVYCQGTDPELILAIEAQKQDEVFAWHFAAASFTDYGLKLRLDDKEVWTSEPRSASRTGPHWVESVAKERLPDGDPTK